MKDAEHISCSKQNAEIKSNNRAYYDNKAKMAIQGNKVLY